MAPFKNLFKKKKRSDRPASVASSEDEVGKYDLIEELGRGGFAVVNRVHLKGQAEGKDVAMRLVPMEVVRQDPRTPNLEALRSRLQWAKDIPVQYNVTTRHVLFLLEFKITKKELITFSEVCNGGDLFDRILASPGGKMSESDAREATRSLCEALFEVHRVGAIHRDVKPENILFREISSPASDLALTDFGCALTRVKRNEYFTGVTGSPGYCAPEMLAGQPYNMLVDEWSLGITVYEMLTGRSPLVSETPEDIARETLERKIPWPARYWLEISPEAKAFTQGLLGKDPKKRMTVEDAQNHPWLKMTSSSSEPVIDSSTVDVTHPEAEEERTISVATKKTLAKSMATTRFGAAAPGTGTQIDLADVMAGRVNPEELKGLQAISSDNTPVGSGPETIDSLPIESETQS